MMRLQKALNLWGEEKRRAANQAAVLLACAALCACFCASKKEIPSSADHSSPAQIVTNSTIYLFNGSRKAWKLESTILRKSLDQTGATLGYPVKLTIYDSLGAERSICLADSGSTNDRKDAFEAWGNVYVKNEEGTVVRAHRLRWDGNRHTVSSDSFVQITTANGDVMRGKGMDATETFSRWSFRKDVSGEFPNFRKRMDSEEGIFGASQGKRPASRRARTGSDAAVGDQRPAVSSDIPDGSEDQRSADKATGPRDHDSAALKEATE